MKSLVRALACVIMMLAVAAPQLRADDNEEWKAPKKFTSIGYAHTTFTNPNFEVKSKFGISLNKSTTYYLHKPIANRLRFGIDVVWTDLTYSNYELPQADPREADVKMHEVDITVQAGLGINFNITRHSSLHGYFRYAPGFMGVYDSEDFRGGFLNSAIGGVLINYRMIGCGIEYRFGQSKHKALIGNYDEETGYEAPSDEKVTSKIKGIRAFVCIRF